jgi:hypothetical protein
MAGKAAGTEERIGRVAQREGSVVTKPKKLADPDDVLTPAEAKKVRHGMKQIKEGRFKLWRDVKHELDR